MSDIVAPPALALDPAVEAAVNQLLYDHFAPSYQDRVSDYIGSLMATEHYSGRFLFLKWVIGPELFENRSRILISGCGAGGEMIAARQWGFGETYGVEVDPIWITACEKRLAYLPEMHVALYDGDHLPYADGMFDVVTSGHVIEHTRDPKLYLAELMRVLRPGGYLSLEYPTRYHRTELHTGLPSLEWAPHPLRNAGYRLLGSRLSPISERSKGFYRSIYETRLQQISYLLIKRWLRANGYGFKFVNLTKAAPGVIRLVIRREA